VREAVLAATRVVASVDASKAAGVALARLRGVNAKLAIDALVMATAALLDAVIVSASISPASQCFRPDQLSEIRSGPATIDRVHSRDALRDARWLPPLLGA
jgi:hypothetical protein